MLMEDLFFTGIMKMGPSRTDPERHVGVFNPDFVSSLPAIRAAEMEKFRWLVGEWDHENVVPATRFSPAYTDVGLSQFSFNATGDWLCMVAPDGKETPHITFDPFSRQWIYLLMRGAFGMLRSADGWQGERIAFTGEMTMLGPTRPWRMTWKREGPDRFHFVNEERTPDRTWAYIDEWRFTRKS
jgi:hypothetical protein